MSAKYISEPDIHGHKVVLKIGTYPKQIIEYDSIVESGFSIEEYVEGMKEGLVKEVSDWHKQLSIVKRSL